MDTNTDTNTDTNKDTNTDTDTETNTGTNADDSQSAPRPVLYARFDRSFGFEFAILIFFGPPLVVLWSFVAYYYYLSGALSFPILKVAVYYSAVFAFALLLYGNNRATRRDRGVILDGERIVKKGGVVSMLDYADVRGVRCTRNPLFNKKMVIAMAAGKMTLPLNLRGSYKMVETIFEKLAACGRFKEDGAAASGARRRLYITALQYNALYGLRGRHIPGFVALAVAAGLFNGTVAALYWERGLAAALAWGFAGMLFQTLGYFAAERLWAWRLFESAESGGVKGFKSVNDRDGYDLFKTIHAAAAVTALLLGMTAGIAVTLPAS